MRAILIDEPGDPDVMRWGQAPDPTPRPGEVLIDVAAAGVNRADLLQRAGGYPPPAGASEILGLECAGTIAALPGGADHDGGAEPDGRAGPDGAWPGGSGPGGGAGLRVGDRVCALLSGGGYAQRVAVPAGQVLPIPEGLSLAEAAALPEVVCTVWSNLVMAAGLTRGQTVLVHGGSSGIGTMAIQIATMLGARTIVTAGTAEKVAACRSLGATAINYRQEDFVERVLAETDGHGADVILDVVGADYLARNVAAVADGGRIVIIGLLGGARTEINLAALMDKRASVTGTKLRSRRATGPGSKAEVVAQVREHVWPLIADGRISPVIGARLPIDRAPEAHRMLRAGEVVGKIVLEIPHEAGGRDE